MSGLKENVKKRATLEKSYRYPRFVIFDMSMILMVSSMANSPVLFSSHVNNIQKKNLFRIRGQASPVKPNSE